MMEDAIKEYDKLLNYLRFLKIYKEKLRYINFVFFCVFLFALVLGYIHYDHISDYKFVFGDDFFSESNYYFYYNIKFSFSLSILLYFFILFLKVIKSYFYVHEGKKETQFLDEFSFLKIIEHIIFISAFFVLFFYFSIFDLKSPFIVYLITYLSLAFISFFSFIYFNIKINRIYKKKTKNDCDYEMKVLDNYIMNVSQNLNTIEYIETYSSVYNYKRVNEIMIKHKNDFITKKGFNNVFEYKKHLLENKEMEITNERS